MSLVCDKMGWKPGEKYDDFCDMVRSERNRKKTFLVNYSNLH